MQHPKICRTFSQHEKCKFTKCAYFHKPDENTFKIDTLKLEVSELKKTVEELFKRNNEL